MLELLVALSLINAFGSTEAKPRGFSMFRAFNAFQLVTLFSAMPYLIGWLGSDPFPYSTAAFWTAICVYVVMFGGFVASLTHSIYDFDK